MINFKKVKKAFKHPLLFIVDSYWFIYCAPTKLILNIFFKNIITDNKAHVVYHGNSYLENSHEIGPVFGRRNFPTNKTKLIYKKINSIFHHIIVDTESVKK